LVTHEGKSHYEKFRISVNTYFDSALRKGGQQEGGNSKLTIIGHLPDPPPPEDWSSYKSRKDWIIYFDCNWSSRQILLESSLQRRNRIRETLSESMEPIFQRISEIESVDDRLRNLG